MVWTIHIVKDGERYVHVANELHAALAVASVFLRSGIGVEQIEGPDGQRLGIETIKEFCDCDTEPGNRRQGRLRVLRNRGGGAQPDFLVTHKARGYGPARRETR